MRAMRRGRRGSVKLLTETLPLGVTRKAHADHHRTRGWHGLGAVDAGAVRELLGAPIGPVDPKTSRTKVSRPDAETRNPWTDLLTRIRMSVQSSQQYLGIFRVNFVA